MLIKQANDDIIRKYNISYFTMGTNVYIYALQPIQILANKTSLTLGYMFVNLKKKWIDSSTKDVGIISIIYSIIW